MTRQTKLKLRKGFVKAPLVYRVLAIDLLKPQDKKIVIKTLVKITTDSQAKALVEKGGKWGYSVLDSLHTPRVGILKYKGVEVAVFFKRVTTIIEPAPVDPAPEGALEHEEDVWTRFDLFGHSIRQQHKEVRTEMTAQEKELQLMHIELTAKEKVITSLETQIKSLTTQLKEKKFRKEKK